MFTIYQIRTLNDARTILNSQKTPDSRGGGRAAAAYIHAEDALFKALNVTRAYLRQPIPDDLMHNREERRTRDLGSAAAISVVDDENGFELHFTTDEGQQYVVNVHGVTEDLIVVGKEMVDYWTEGRRLAGEHRAAAENIDAYDTLDVPAAGEEK